jgi:aerobic carbon-monoxide dehydrogenase small subunit
LSKSQVIFKLNGSEVKVSVPNHMLLVDFIRDTQGLTGTHIGCDTSQCGACHVLLEDEPVKSCSLLVVQVDGKSVETIESLALDETLHPMQQAFHEHHGLQCGFCTSGMIMTGIGIVKRRGVPTRDEIREDLEGNFCRCTGYNTIVDSIEAGAIAMARKG